MSLWRNVLNTFGETIEIIKNCRSFGKGQYYFQQFNKSSIEIGLFSKIMLTKQKEGNIFANLIYI